MKEYVFYTDAGHGWLEVSLDELIKLGIKSAISQYSYIRGQKVYLEEDCDAGVFDDAMKTAGIQYKCRHVYQGNDSPIRNFERYFS